MGGLQARRSEGGMEIMGENGLQAGTEVDISTTQQGGRQGMKQVAENRQIG